MHPSAEDCCTNMVPWIATSVCTSESTSLYINEGTGKFYVSYESNKCVKDCPIGEELCGGAAESHLTLYEDAVTCCAQKLWWLGYDCVSDSLGN